MSRLDDATTSRLYIEISNPPPDSSRFKMKVNCKNSSRVKYISDRDISLFQLRILLSSNLEFENFGEKKVDGIYGVG